MSQPETARTRHSRSIRAQTAHAAAELQPSASLGQTAIVRRSRSGDEEYEKAAIFERRTSGFNHDGAGDDTVRQSKLRLALLALLVVVLLLYVGDTVVLQIRIRRGAAYRVVQVNQFLTTPLKGQKEEYDLIGTTPVTCARSIFPQPLPWSSTTPACWWLERHTSQWQ